MTSEPVLLIAFNRPVEFARVVDRLRAVAPSRIYVAVDGPRPGHPTDAEQVARTKAVVDTIDWPCTVTTLYRDENLGCGRGVSGAISWFLEHEERGIILEDDILPQPTFFDFCTELLDRYEDDPRVLAISGCNFVPPEQLGRPGGYRFSRVPHIWGWATWRRAWNLHSWDIADWQRDLPPARLWKATGRSVAGYLHWKTLFDMMARHEIDTWDFQLVYAGMVNEALTATSNVNLVDNIGWGADATHTADRPSYLRPSEPMALPTAPVPVEVDEQADNWSRRVVFGATFDGLMRGGFRYVRARMKRK
jgi:hypothetical protein